MREHVLVVLPHPDDESFGVGGLMSLKRNEGIPVTYACATLGQMGRNMGNPLFANREILPEIRKKELRDACDALNVQDLRMLGLRDKTLEFEDIDRFADIIEEIIQEVKPTLVVTFYPGHGVHPDHDATGAATIRALSRMPLEERPETYCVAITRNRAEVLGEHDVTIDISSVAEMKLNALRAHRSQTEGMLKQMEEKFKNKDPEVMHWVEQEIFWTYKWNDE
ncbi:bacillithiol biosynthesis deacetylase BshB2 [Metabacillus idriensis]|uniref:Bacillithiol biosynthesis deacetylase BshB2 n=1 Tax=Metabacillus idriensis TaxID=324768 RepID=A0A6I2MGT5_9BACI|nr:bacillithiol biosynthesis deacetylase BshB2 [Metabacillus idriensis]MCM3595925.1 bacillithiol biosynthesis deacetylase BshB2 [Metabacillus idriensis]MRX56256.1 bacillithiol biosynthesis deacetylase BshB2 [Metabacillus idriensis]OHR69780.1 bacillithiol biosynthesis deacetylase BshB2 [Bacillus sp. HMSC76G11]